MGAMVVRCRVGKKERGRSWENFEGKKARRRDTNRYKWGKKSTHE